MTLIRKPFVFIRHGEIPANATNIIAGITDTPLSDKGIEQAQSTRKILNQEWSVVAVSNLQRTQQTASNAVPHCSQVILSGLAERNWGELEGCSVLNPMPYLETPNNGESWQCFKDRVISAINQLLIEYDHPLIVAHSGVYRVLCDHIQGSPFGTRINNAMPYLFTPEHETDWNISKYKGELNES